MKDLETVKAEITFERVRVTKKDKENLGKNKYIQQWFANVPSPETRYTYGSMMIKFLRSVHLTVDELIELRKATDIKEGYYPIETLIDFWKVKAKENGKKTHYRRNVMTTLESFFIWNRLSLEKIKKPAYSPEEKSEIKKEDLRQFRDSIGNIRNVALFDLLCSVPLRIGMFRPCNCGDCDKYWYPKWGHIQSFPNLEYGAVVKIPAKKGHTSSAYYEQGQRLYYIGFLTESAKQSLTMYKKLTEEQLGRPLTKEDPIFIGWRENGGNGRKPIKDGEVNRIFEHASEVSGLKFTVHDLRNFVNSTLERHGINKRLRDINLAHKVSDLVLAYSTHNIETMWKGTKEAIGFEKVLPYVDVGNSHYKMTMLHDERLEKLEKERDELRKTIEEMKADQEALKRRAKRTGVVDYDTVKDFLGLMQKNPKRLEAILQDIKFKAGMKELAEKGKKEKEEKEG